LREAWLSASGSSGKYGDWGRTYAFTANQQGNNRSRGNWQCDDGRTDRIDCHFTGRTVDGDWYESGGRFEFTIQFGTKVD
jgi:hypothetical protein